MKYIIIKLLKFKANYFISILKDINTRFETFI